MQAKYTAKANDKISEARGKQPQPALNEEMSVNRYNAMKAAAAAAINRWVLCLSLAAAHISPQVLQSHSACKACLPDWCAKKVGGECEGGSALAECRLCSQTPSRLFKRRPRKLWIRGLRWGVFCS